MCTSPSISSVSYRTVSGEHLKTRIIDLYIYNLCIFFSSKMEKHQVDIPKTALVFLPIVFSQIRRSDASHLLETGSFSFDSQLPKQFPQENWDKLFSSSFKACKLAATSDGPTIPDLCAEIGTTSRGGSLHTMSMRLKGLFKSSK